MKTKEELNALKKEVETLNKKLAELTEEELAQVGGGTYPIIPTSEWEKVTDANCGRMYVYNGICKTSMEGGPFERECSTCKYKK